MYTELCRIGVRPRSRQKFGNIVKRGQIPLPLILNYDQTWINGYRQPKCTLRLKRTKRGSKNLTRVLALLGGRKGVSLCASSWANGDRGPLFVSVGANAVPQKFITEMNQHPGSNESLCVKC